MEKSAMKKQVVLSTVFMALTIPTLIGGIVGAYKVGFANGQNSPQNYNKPTTVQTVTDLNMFDDFIVKDSKGLIIYKGSGQNMASSLKESPVLNMGVCEDTPQTLCIFVD